MAELQYRTNIITGKPSEVGWVCNEELKASVAERNTNCFLFVRNDWTPILYRLQLTVRILQTKKQNRSTELS